MPNNDFKHVKKSIRKGEQGVKSGRSIEETLVKRRLDVTDPLSWPTGDLQTGNLKALVLKPPVLPTREHSREHYLPSEGRSLSPARTAKTSEHEVRARQLQVLLHQRDLLEARVIELENTLMARDQQEIHQVQSGGTSRGASRGGFVTHKDSRVPTPYSTNSDGMSGRSESRPPSTVRSRNSDGIVPQDAIASTMDALDGIDDRMGDLQLLYHRDDPLERRHAAVTKIAARIRGVLARMRLAAYLRSMAEWRWSRCRHAIRCLDIMLSGQTTLESRIEQKQTIMETRLLRATYGGWKSITQINADKRKDITQALAELLVERRVKMVKKAFTILYRYTIGPLSSKQLVRDRKLLAISIRNELSALQLSKGLSGIVLPEDFKQCFRRKMVSKFEAQKTLKLKATCFAAFVGVLRNKQWNDYSAAKHWYRKCAGKFFYYWTEWNYEYSQGLDRKRWKAPRRYEVRYSQKRVDNFSRLRLLKSIFRPWKEKQKLWREASRRFRKYQRKFIYNHFHALVTMGKTLRQYRINAIANWQGYAVLMMTKPFRAWAGWVIISQKAFAEKTLLAKNYRIWKVRQLMLLIVRTWRHQALYGRTDGMFNTSMMAKNLKEQKAFGDRVEKMMVAQVVELEECKDLIDREIQKRRDLEDRLQVTVLDIQRFEMITHHAEQEVKRLDAIIKAITIINPQQVKHLRKVQPSFRLRGNVPWSAGDAEKGGLGEVSRPDSVNSVPSLFIDGKQDLTSTNQPGSRPDSPRVISIDPTRTTSIDGTMSAAIATAIAGAAAMAVSTGGDTGNIDQEKTQQRALAAAITAMSQPGSMNNVLNNQTIGGTDDGNPDNVKNMIRRLSSQMQMMVDMTDQFLLDRAKWIVERFGKHPDIPQPWEIIPPMEKEIDPEEEIEEFISKVKRKVSDYPGFGVRRFSKLFPALFKKTDSVFSIKTTSSRESGFSGRASEMGSGGYGYSMRDGYSTRDDISSSRHGSVNLPQGGVGLPRRSESMRANEERAAIDAAIMEERMRTEKASTMLVGLIDFLSMGEVSILGLDDKKDWTRNILNSVNESSSVTSSMVAQDHGPTHPTAAKIGLTVNTKTDTALTSNNNSVSPTNVPEATINRMLGIPNAPSPALSGHTEVAETTANNATLNAAAAALNSLDHNKTNAFSSITPNTQISFGINGAIDFKTKGMTMEHKKKEMKAEMESETSWRGALWKLRALFPGGGNYSGVGVSLDPNTLLVNEGGYGDGNGMWSRIQEMRRTQDALKIIAEKNATKIAAELDASERNRIQSVANRITKSKGGGSILHTIHSFSEGEFMEDNISYKLVASISQRQKELEELTKLMSMTEDEIAKHTSTTEIDPITATTNV